MRVNNWLSGFACVLLLGVVGCKKDKIREGIPVVVEKVGVDDVEIFGDYVGRIRARQFVEVHARVEGYLEKMLFEEGKRVERNQPLFIINPDLYKARADKAAAQLKKDEAQELKTGRDVERLRPLYEQNAASQLDLDNAIAAYESAKANVAMSKADLAQAEMELGYTKVRSPIRDTSANGMPISVPWWAPAPSRYWRPSWPAIPCWSILASPPSIISAASSVMSD